jgi:hypothetical protein
MTKISRIAIRWFQSDNLKSKTCTERRRSIQNRKWAGIVALVVTFAMCGAVAQAQQPTKVPRIAYVSGSTRGTYGDIESRFGHVDTDKDRGNFQNSILLAFSFLQHSSTLRMMRALITQATVRALGRPGRDDPCSRSASNDLGVNDLSRPVSN